MFAESSFLTRVVVLVTLLGSLYSQEEVKPMVGKTDSVVDLVTKLEGVRASLTDADLANINSGNDVVSVKIAPLLKAVDNPDELMRMAIVCYWLSRSQSNVIHNEVFAKSFNATMAKIKLQKQVPKFRAALLEIKNHIIVDGEIGFWFDDL